MKLKTCLILLLLCLLFLQCSSQRGGGSRSRSSSRSSRSSRGYHSSSSTKQYVPRVGKLEGFIALGFGVAILVFFFNAWMKNRGTSYFMGNRTKEVRKITNRFQRINQENICTLTEDERNTAIDWFMSAIWTIEYKQQNGSQGTFLLRIKDITKRTDFVYQIQAIGQNDSLGTSVIKGVLLFQNTYLSICFDKLYDDREKAGQAGKWDMLIYEGVQQGQVFQGSWYYEGFKWEAEFSGEMRMIHN